jgi:hypothetical protein
MSSKTPSEMHHTITKLHDDGLVNVDVSTKKIVESLKTLNVPQGESWAVIAGSHYFLVTERVKSGTITASEDVAHHPK